MTRHGISKVSQGNLNLNILYFNARSIYPKLDELCALCVVERPDIICITESWLHEEILPLFQVMNVLGVTGTVVAEIIEVVVY